MDEKLLFGVLGVLVVGIFVLTIGGTDVEAAGGGGDDPTVGCEEAGGSVWLEPVPWGDGFYTFYECEEWCTPELCELECMADGWDPQYLIGYDWTVDPMCWEINNGQQGFDVWSCECITTTVE